MPNWRLIIEIICQSNADYQRSKINNSAFKCPFVAIANVKLRWIQGYNIENAQDWRIYNESRFEAIENAQDCTLLKNHVQQRHILIHLEFTGTRRNAQGCTGAHESARGKRIISDKGHRKRLINEQTNTQLPFAVVVSDVLFFVLLLWIQF